MSESTTMQFSAEISKVLQLMIHSLYTNKDIFLRELISNASDACDKLRYEALTNPELLKEDSELKIRLLPDAQKKTLTVSDNGIGMSRDELIRNLGTIAKSGTQEFLSQITGDSKKDMPLIGQFGVGFYASFMVADKVEVTSRRAGEKTAHRWISEGSGEFSVSEAGEAPRGTSITLFLKEGEEEYLDAFKLKFITQTYSDHISFPIECVGEDGKAETVNTASALWARAKSEITAEQYKEFYHHAAHSPDDPWLVLHNHAEGKLEYTNLLFVPSMRPFDLFHPDRRCRVKLYVKRVFITDENVDLVPHYMRFLRGIVDSQDLPLNISRETLQKNPLLDRIRDSVVNRVLAELKKKAEKDAEGYAKFWGNFGAVLKEGLCEAIAPKEKILEVCRFATTRSPDKLVSLDEYIGHMKKGQNRIFFLSGESVEALMKSPQLEGFLNRDIEVLLLTDHVDDFWVNVAFKYKDAEFLSVTRSNVDLDTLGAAPENPDENKKKPESHASLDDLIALFKRTFSEELKEVRVSKKLTQSPVCLAVEEGSMDIRLERFMLEHKQLPGKAPKILEINPAHPIIVALAEKAKAGASAELTDALHLLLDQAKIQEGEILDDPGAFSRRLSGFMQKSLAA